MPDHCPNCGHPHAGPREDPMFTPATCIAALKRSIQALFHAIGAEKAR